MTRALLALALGLAAALGARPGRAGGEEFDAALYARLLERHTRSVPDTAGTRVDYAGLAASPEWDALIANLARARPPGPDAPQARMALWINAYNVLAIDLVRRHWPVPSIRAIGGLLSPVWKREAGRVGGRAVSLDEIEHGILRPLGDPRVHAAIVCASVSCPSLRREPYAAARLDAQLDDAVRRWLSDPVKGLSVEPARRVLRISSIFDWFAGDFDAHGGVRRFVSAYAPEAQRAWLEGDGRDASIQYLEYDWSVNALAGAAGGG